VDVSREKDADQLRRIAQAALSENERLTRVLALQGAELDRLRGNTGATQESLTLLEQLRAREAKTKSRTKNAKSKRSKKRGKSGPTPQPELPVVERTYELDAADQVCTSCGGELAVFDGQFEESELVDVIEVNYQLVKVMRQKYRCGCGACVDTALGPERAVPGGRYSLGFAAKVATDKYLDHLPLERQSRIMKRHGLKVTSQTLWKQLDVLARDLRPAYDALLAQVLSQPVIGLDQTSWKRLSNKNATPFQMWCLTSPGVVVHTIRNDKSKVTFFDIIGDFEGIITCDALSTHKSAARTRPKIQLAGCWAHVHRRFAEAEPDHPEAGKALGFIRQLYAIDDEADDDLDTKLKLRQTRSKLVLDEMRAWLNDLSVLTSTSFGSAARYTFDNWNNLARFITNARIPLDNNATERGIRGPVVGRKNHYGSKSQRGTDVASIFYTLLETAKLNELNPAEYLANAVLAARRGEVVLPLA
tara:strand:+ start:912 stop:2336 length:1425 start_codon:yes stop_codon:yes gene_type:complete